MLTIVLISDLATARRLPEALLTGFPNMRRQPFVDIAGQSEHRLLVEDGDHWLAARRCDPIGAEYDDGEMDAILSVFPEPCFVVVEGRGPALASQALLGVDGSLRFLVDNDHGLICPIGEIKRRIGAGRDWMYETS